MKILVLMPLDEKWSYIATAIYKNLSAKAKENTFVMNMFSEWQMNTKHMVAGADLPIHWNVATFGSIIKARELYKLQEQSKKDFILIGNIDPSYKFDLIVNFQDLDKDLPYEDLYVQKLREVFKENDYLTQLLVMYSTNSSTMMLHNTTAAAKFLSAYLETDPCTDEIKEKYKDALKFKEDKHYA